MLNNGPLLIICGGIGNLSKLEPGDRKRDETVTRYPSSCIMLLICTLLTWRVLGRCRAGALAVHGSPAYLLPRPPLLVSLLVLLYY